jgi:trk system potassium uptake protein TrkH
MKSSRRRHLAPGLRLIIGFALIIVLGGIVLYLPISHQSGKAISFIDSFFTSASAVCVTGLSTIDCGNTLSTFGSIVLATLIQIGGLGFASFALFILMLIGSSNYSEMKLASEALNSSLGFDIKSIVRTVIMTSIICESIGTLLSYQVFIHDYPSSRALGLSLFHSISSFNNAGFDLLGNFTGLTKYKDNVILNLTTSSLIIIGGLGFYVIRDIFVFYKKNKRLKMHTQIVLLMTFSLLFLGTVAFHFSEHISWLAAFFQSTTTRTAGFNTIDMSSLSNAGSMLTLVLMFIGASPGSTGGGVKTTTFFTVIQSIRKIGRHAPVSAFHRTIDDNSILKAFMVIVLGIFFTLVASCIIFIIEGTQFTFLQILFECISAFATVGLSMGVTTHLSIASKITIIILMFIGRLGPLTVTSSWRRSEKHVQYIPEEILIG